MQVYGSVVANRYSNQHILPLSQMSVSAECFYQPRVNADFDEDSEQMELSKWFCYMLLIILFVLLKMWEMHFKLVMPTSLFMYLPFPMLTRLIGWQIYINTSTEWPNQVCYYYSDLMSIMMLLLVVSGDSQLVTKPVWVPDAMSKECMICSVKFTAFVRKHHCRRCGRVICSTCSPHRISPELQTRSHMHHASDSKKLERVCKECFKDASFCNNKSGGKVVDVYV